MCISALGLKGISNPISNGIPVFSEDGKLKNYDSKFVLQMIDKACEDLSEPWKIEQLYSRIEASIYGGITENQIIKLTLDTADFYALYDKEFIVVSNKLKKKLEPLIKEEEKSPTLYKMNGFSLVLS
ncbi:MAG TPA: hypothetical protein VHE53_03270 [Patescibacteria group bacterium]|nr:hypothetical protein [Patescibacteria group bacterium]